MSSDLGVRLATLDDARSIGQLHSDVISEGFLSTFGVGFLELLYRRIVVSDSTFAVVHADGREPVDGFVAVAEHTHALYREFIVHDGFRAAFSAALSVGRHPKRTYETVRYGLGRGADAPGAEILATAVRAERRGRGIGQQLVRAALEELAARGLGAAHVVTATSNHAALRTYTSCGFRSHRTIEVHRGVSQQVLVWP